MNLLNFMNNSKSREVHIVTSLPWDLVLLLRGASRLHLWVRWFSLYCSHYPPQRGSSTDLLRLERGLKVGQNPPCEDMHCCDSPHCRSQQNAGRLLSLAHWKASIGGIHKLLKESKETHRSSDDCLSTTVSVQPSSGWATMQCSLRFSILPTEVTLQYHIKKSLDQQ